jgi:hypothetical protein
MRAYTFASITAYAEVSSIENSVGATEEIDDSLSILGLRNEPTSYLKLNAECTECAIYLDNMAYYQVYIPGSTISPCTIESGQTFCARSLSRLPTT